MSYAPQTSKQQTYIIKIYNPDIINLVNLKISTFCSRLVIYLFLKIVTGFEVWFGLYYVFRKIFFSTVSQVSSFSLVL